MRKVECITLARSVPLNEAIERSILENKSLPSEVIDEYMANQVSNIDTNIIENSLLDTVPLEKIEEYLNTLNHLAESVKNQDYETSTNLRLKQQELTQMYPIINLLGISYSHSQFSEYCKRRKRDEKLKQILE